MLKIDGKTKNPLAKMLDFIRINTMISGRLTLLPPQKNQATRIPSSPLPLSSFMDATAWRLCLGWPWLFVVLGLMSAGSVTRAQTLSLTGGLEGMNTTSGTASAAQSFAVSGTGLTGAPVEVVPPAGYEVALNRDFSSATGTATLPLSLGNQSEIGTLVFVRLASTEAVGSLLFGNIS